jgi:uncharacterized protein (DUF4415 family)
MKREKPKELVPEAPAREVSFRGGVRGKYARRVAAVGKERITIMLDADVLEYFRSLAREAGAAPYQTQINSALRTAMTTSWRDDGRAELLDDEGFIAAVAERVRTYTK